MLNSRYRPVMPPSPLAEGGQNAAVPAPCSAMHDPISALVDGLQAVSIADPSGDAAEDRAQKKDAPTPPSSSALGSLPRRVQIPAGPTKLRLKDAKKDDVADLVGQLQSLGLAEAASGKAQKKLALDDIFDRGLPQEDSENGKSDRDACTSPPSSKAEAPSEKGSQNSSPAASSSNDSGKYEHPPTQRHASSGKWRPIGATEDTTQKKESAVLSNSTNLPHNLPTFTTQERSSSPCSSSGSQSADVPDSGYASAMSNSGSASATERASADSNSGKPRVVASKPPASLFVPRQVSKKSTGSVRSTSGRVILDASSPAGESKS
ncbi:hypothetical protein DENSPDRAFT_328391 [Dentipellis sp. KUC8613]|nr:hypothetical protein DENSPDRAFT_328391 [Dentipellis sp. KUC8613]